MSNLEEIVCITETKRKTEDIEIIQNIVQLETNQWVFIINIPENVHVSKSYAINLGIENLIDDSELRKEVKKVIETVVGLLKDKVEVDDSSDSKKKNVKKILSKIDMYITLTK
ncbi:hypothetical protein F8M41_007501 [Gigaspora margarita]|uniref:Uncharacterized protein n=1 Tax=Gigaspora margarita TaxID=4874 RepID=A0A8H3X7G3_GIGMA|nr:hypothetical protein F8M41_007501 [Gigaspora margarita]